MMHEYALAASILQQVSAVRNDRRLGSIRSVQIQLGAFSGVEPLLLKSAFEELSELQLGTFAELQIETSELVAECERCAVRFEVVQFRFHCPHCGNEQVRIRQGEELMLLSITADTSQ